MKKGLLIGLVVALAVAATAAVVWANAGPVSYWPFDEGSGTAAYDAVNGNHGTISGATHVAGRFGTALNFDGTDYVGVAEPSGLEPSTVTVAAWVSSSGPGKYSYILSKGAYACIRASYALYTGSSGGLFFYIYSPGAAGVLSPDAGPSVWDGNWHHVAGTYDGSFVRLYVDGAEKGTGTPTSSPGIQYGLSPNHFLVGAYADGCFLPFKGLIDEVGVWDRALSADEVAALGVGVGSVEWLPPITLPDWTLNENATLPIKFKLYGPYGNLICADMGPTLGVNGQLLDLRFDSTECYYISNFRPTDSGSHTAVVTLGTVTLASQDFEVVEPGKANGRGHGNN